MRGLRLILILALLAMELSAHATPLLSFDNNVDDIFMPGPKAVGAFDAWSLYTNAAGLSFVDGAQFVGGYAYRVSSFDDGRHLAEGSLGLSIIEGLSFGLGLQLSLPQAQVGDDQGLLGGALGVAYRYERAIALGFRVIKQRQYKNAEADPFLLSFGAQSFPTSWLGLGASASQVFSDILAKPEIRAGLAFKPFGDTLTLSAESLFWPNEGSTGGDYAIYPELSARVDLGSISLLASARGSDVTQSFLAPTLFVGLEFNLEHLGFGLISQGHPSDRVAVGGKFRLSSEVWPPLAQKRERIVSQQPFIPSQSFPRSHYATNFH